jgi:hypothetical protein
MVRLALLQTLNKNPAKTLQSQKMRKKKMKPKSRRKKKKPMLQPLSEPFDE